MGTGGGQLPDPTLVTDDAEGRRVARGFGLRVTGLLGVLIEAKVRGLLPAVGPVLDQFMAEGCDAMRMMILRSAGE
jgi:predicted nucleic acid-binding protein